MHSTSPTAGLTASHSHNGSGDARDPFSALAARAAQKSATAAAASLSAHQAAHLASVHSFQAPAPPGAQFYGGGPQQQHGSVQPLHHLNGSSATASPHASSNNVAAAVSSNGFHNASSSSSSASTAQSSQQQQQSQQQQFVLPTSEPLLTSSQRLPWDRTAMPHGSIITAEAVGPRERFRPRFPSDKIREKMDTIKLKHRSSLKLPDWQRYNYYASFAQLRAEAYAMMPRLTSSPQLADGRANAPYVTPPAASSLGPPQPELSYSIDRVHWKELSLEQFRTRYEIPKIPVIIQGLTDEWEMRKWDLHSLGNETGSFRNVPMKCGGQSQSPVLLLLTLCPWLSL
jgi:hypothetical protein